MFVEYWGFTEWSTVATILLSVVAIVIAIWSSHSTSKAAEKQISEIKQLSVLQAVIQAGNGILVCPLSAEQRVRELIRQIDKEWI